VSPLTFQDKLPGQGNATPGASRLVSGNGISPPGNSTAPAAVLAPPGTFERLVREAKHSRRKEPKMTQGPEESEEVVVVDEEEVEEEDVEEGEEEVVVEEEETGEEEVVVEETAE
jgi:hypothetical protein